MGTTAGAEVPAAVAATAVATAADAAADATVADATITAAAPPRPAAEFLSLKSMGSLGGLAA